MKKSASADCKPWLADGAPQPVCPKCGQRAERIETRVTYRGNRCVPDSSGAYIRTTCAACRQWIGNRPVTTARG